MKKTLLFLQLLQIGTLQTSQILVLWVSPIKVTFSLEFEWISSSVRKESDEFLFSGATCYLNSLLQTLFMTPEFREHLFKWRFNPTVDGDPKRFTNKTQKKLTPCRVDISWIHRLIDWFCFVCFCLFQMHSLPTSKTFCVSSIWRKTSLWNDTTHKEFWMDSSRSGTSLYCFTLTFCWLFV